MENESEIKRKLEKFEYFKLSEATYEGLKKNLYLGAPEEIIERIMQYVDLGIIEFTLYFPDGYKVSPIEEFAENILTEKERFNTKI